MDRVRFLTTRGGFGEIWDVSKREHLSRLIRDGDVVAIPFDQISLEEVEKLASSLGVVFEADGDRQLFRVRPK